MKLASTGDYLGMYHVQLDGIKSGGVSLAAGDSVIVDTGATHLVLPEEVGQRAMVSSLDADFEAPSRHLHHASRMAG